MIDVRTLMRPIHAIITVRTRMPMPREVYYAVTIDPAKKSQSGNFIRLGNVQGDEFVGWVPVDDIDVREILGEFEVGEHVPFAETSGVTQEVAH